MWWCAHKTGGPYAPGAACPGGEGKGQGRWAAPLRGTAATTTAAGAAAGATAAAAATKTGGPSCWGGG